MSQLPAQPSPCGVPWLRPSLTATGGHWWHSGSSGQALPPALNLLRDLVCWGWPAAQGRVVCDRPPSCGCGWSLTAGCPHLEGQGAGPTSPWADPEKPLGAPVSVLPLSRHARWCQVSANHPVTWFLGEVEGQLEAGGPRPLSAPSHNGLPPCPPPQEVIAQHREAGAPRESQENRLFLLCRIRLKVGKTGISRKRPELAGNRQLVRREVRAGSGLLSGLTPLDPEAGGVTVRRGVAPQSCG